MSDFANRLLGRPDAAPVRPLLPSRFEPITPLRGRPLPHVDGPAAPDDVLIEPETEPVEHEPLSRVDSLRLAAPEDALVEPEVVLGDEPLPQMESTWPEVEPGQPVGRRVGGEVSGPVAPQQEWGAVESAEAGRALARQARSAEAPSSEALSGTGMSPRSGVEVPVGFPVGTSRLLTGSPWQAVESGEETRRGAHADSFSLAGEESPRLTGSPSRPGESGEKPRRPAESGAASRPAATEMPPFAVPAEPPVVVSAQEPVAGPKPVHAVAPREWLPAPDPEPVVHITIGRVEVRAAAEPAPAPVPRSPRRRQALGLDEYLRRKAGG